MERPTTRLKIKIEEYSLTPEDALEWQKWENEGGAPLKRSTLTRGADLPVRPGQVFEILDGEVILEDGAFYYLAEVHLLSMH